MKLAVIMVTHARPAMLKRCIDSLCTVEGDYESFVFALKDGSAESERCIEIGLSYCKAGWIDRLIVEPKSPCLFETFRRGIDYALAGGMVGGFLLTADDYEYKPTWYESLTKVLAVSEKNRISHLTLNVEPDFAWNKIRSEEDINGVHVRMRDTIPGANWAMTRLAWRRMRTVYQNNELSPVLDHYINKEMRHAGYQLGAIDEAEHAGALHSTCGNMAYQAAEVAQ